MQEMWSRVPLLVNGLEVSPLPCATRERCYILTHSSGRRWQISEDMRVILSLIDGKRDTRTIARVCQSSSLSLSEDEIGSAIWHHLLQMRVVESRGEKTSVHPVKEGPRHRRGDMLVRFQLFSPRMLQPITRFFQYLFCKPIAATVGVSAILLHIGLLYDHFSFSVDRYSGWGWMFIFGILCASTIFHEFGHASACRRFGGIHKGIGVGTYLITPVLYADVSDAWRLPRMQKVVVDIGGVYFQFLFATAVLLWSRIAGSELLRVAAISVDASCVLNLNPFMKWDGYWLLSDLVGVPNLHRRTWDILRFRKDALIAYEDSTRLFLYVYSGATLVCFAGFIYGAIRSSVALVNGDYWRLWLSLGSEITAREHFSLQSMAFLAVNLLLSTALLAFVVRWVARGSSFLIRQLRTSQRSSYVKQ